jgi:FixJ family two-component response regulator
MQFVGLPRRRNLSPQNGAGPLDCVITNPHMRDMSGIDLIRELQAQGSTVPKVIFILRAARVIARAGSFGQD